MSYAMRGISAGTIARAYVVTMLLLAVLASSPFQLGLAIVLVAIQLFCAYKQSNSSLNLVLTVGSLVFAPLALEALVGGLFAVLLVIPALPVLDQALRYYAVTQVVSFSRKGRKAGEVLKALAVGLILVLLVSVIAWNLTLILTVVLLLGYAGFASAFILQRVPKTTLEVKKTWGRTVAGDTDSRIISFKGKARVPLRVFLQPVDSWVCVEPSSFTLATQGGMDATLRFTPPLAGPSTIQLQACSVDSRGLIVSGQVLVPIDLHIIPRAKFAQWLANKFLEQTSLGTGISVASAQSSRKAAKRGVEFFGNRPYQSGDRLKDVDWKHSYMLGELIVKEFSGAHGNNGIIVANLTAKNVEAADRLAYNFVMSALTLALEALPSALAVYNQNENLAATSLMNPRETLKKALKLTQRITIVEPKEKVLQPTTIRKLRRSIGQLSKVNGEPARQLSELLKLETIANQEAAKQHPATETLAEATRNVQGSAVMIVASPISDDSDALLLALERLKDKGYSTVMVG